MADEGSPNVSDNEADTADTGTRSAGSGAVQVSTEVVNVPVEVEDDVQGSDMTNLDPTLEVSSFSLFFVYVFGFVCLKPFTRCWSPPEQELDLNQARIKEMTGLEQLVHLKNLCLRQNLIKEVQGLENCTALVELDLRDNLLTHIKGFQLLLALEYVGRVFVRRTPKCHCKSLLFYFIIIIFFKKQTFIPFHPTHTGHWTWRTTVCVRLRVSTC
jgi:Leucine-rich repeat (LRR) protein